MGDYAAALAYLRDRVDLERVRVTPELKHAYKLDRMRALLEALGNPQDAIRCVHVAGTKGKGSTCEMTATCLEACGYTVGLFTSPHISDLRERIRLNRRLISEASLTRLLERAAEAAAGLVPTLGETTFFELLTAVGFLHFAEEAVDVAVIEVGLGGLLDCTNVITPEVAAVTTIGLDHTAILGETVEEIAAQKAGIFKSGVPALTVQQEPGVIKAMRAVADRVGAPFQVVGQDVEFSFRFEWQAGEGPTGIVTLTTDRVNYDHVIVPLKGEHQAQNCGLALAILDKLSERGFHCPEDRVLAGLEQTTLPGRFELAWRSPRVLVDVAHNPDSMRALMKTIGAYMPYDSLVVIFGCAADKDADSMLRALAAGADKVIFTQAAGNARAAAPADLARRYAEISDGKLAQVAPNFPGAIDLASRALGRGDLLCITGSFYLVGEAKAHLKALEARRAATASSSGAGRR
jgi:dihydrofolate synthase/folylpolyglutamate synthase